MLCKRIIPCLDIKDGETVKGVNFENLISAGNPVELAKSYVIQGADELVFLDITATLDKRKTFSELVKKIAREINIPFTVGGGISSIEDVGKLLECGADKISINSSAVKSPNLINTLAKEFGSQCIVVAIDSKYLNNNDKVFIKGGTEETEMKTQTWALEAQERGAGEILLTSMDHDGTKNGFALDLCKELVEKLSIPVIASGGAGKIEHFTELFKETEISAALAASIFHFSEVAIPKLKQELKRNSIAVRF